MLHLCKCICRHSDKDDKERRQLLTHELLQVTPDEMDSYCRLIQKATQAPEPASLTEESLTALFNTLSQPSGIDSFVPDDFAAVYNLAAIFPRLCPFVTLSRHSWTC